MVLWHAVSASDILNALTRLTQPKVRPLAQIHVLTPKTELGTPESLPRP